MLLNQHNYMKLSAHNAVALCPACAESHGRLLGHKESCALSECIRCSTVFMSAQANGHSVKELYNHYYDQARFELPAAAAASLELLAKSFAQFRQTGRWMDTGYGEGGLLSVAEQNGWNCYGTDISPHALEYGQKRGWIVSANAENDLRFPRAGFDVVTMIEFLEHMQSPHEALQAAAQWVRPGGLLYVTTPNVNSLNRRILGLDWSIFSPPEHVTIWSARGLCHALTKAGFKIQRVRTEGLNPCEIVARLRARSETPKSVDRNTAAFALNSAFSSSPSRRAVKMAINRCLSVFGAGDTLKVWAVR